MNKQQTTPNYFKKTIKGLGYLEGYGHHPADGPICVIGIMALVMTVLPWPSGLAMLACWWCIMHLGCYERYTSWEKSKYAK